MRRTASGTFAEQSSGFAQRNTRPCVTCRWRAGFPRDRPRVATTHGLADCDQEGSGVWLAVTNPGRLVSRSVGQLRADACPVRSDRQTVSSRPPGRGPRAVVAASFVRRGRLPVREMELLFAALEPYGEDGGTADNNGVDPASRAWDLELQEDCPGHRVQGALQHLVAAGRAEEVLAAASVPGTDAGSVDRKTGTGAQ